MICVEESPIVTKLKTEYAAKALKTLFISSKGKYMEFYVEFLREAKEDPELDYLHTYIDDEIREFEITDEHIQNMLNSMVPPQL